MQALQAKLRMGGQINAVLMVVALVGMSLARYL
jgi:hypothetical protein